MAYNFNETYSGKDSAVKLPELDSLERSITESGRKAIQGEEKKLDQHLKDKATFMKLMEVDPVMAVATRDQLTQANLLEKYNNKAAEILRRDGLSQSGQMELMKEKALLKAEQNKILANQQQWNAAEQTMQRDTRGYYDRDAYDKARQKYLDTGEWDQNALQVAPQDITAILAHDAPQSSFTEPKQIDVTDDKGNVTGKQYISTEFKRTPEEAKERIFANLQNEPVLKGVLRDFENAPLAEQEAVLKDYDVNKNHRIDPDEYAYMNQSTGNIRDNPIVKWAMNNPKYIAASMGGNPSATKNIDRDRNSSFQWNTIVNANHNQNGTFDEQKDITLGVAKYNRFYNLGIKNYTSASQPLGEYIDLDTGEVVKSDQATRFEVVGYSPDKDQLVVKIKDRVPGLRDGKLVALVASKYDDLLKSKPFGIDRESLMKQNNTVQAQSKATTKAETPTERMKRLAGGK